MIKRRDLLGGLAASLGATRWAGADGTPGQNATPFSPEGLRQRLQQMAASTFQPRAEIPQPWQDLTYDQYRGLRVRHDKAIWWQTDTPYRMEMFPPGLYWPRPVSVNVVEAGFASPVAWDMARFRVTDQVPPLPQTESLGYSGFRLSTALEADDQFNEFLVMQGGTYFRAIGQGQIYGLSARGLAIDTAQPSGEEFPDFVEFWVERPQAGQTDVRIYAMMDSPSVVGLYRFDVVPGQATIMEVEAVIIPRRDVDHVGLAPLTSMFFFDETNRDRISDFRPAVHDSDGLMIQNGAGETLWRPLANPRHLQTAFFVDDGPRGFGLMQRAQSFEQFEDLEALYHRRPSLWIEPRDDWGRGSVALVEIPTEQEIYDNIVAYWLPEAGLKAGQALNLRYRMVWGNQAPTPDPVARVLNTRMGAREGGGILAVIDFEPHAVWPEDLTEVTSHLSVSAGSITDGVVQHNPYTKGVRLAFTFDPGQAASVELRAQLRKQGRLASEVWLYRWTQP